MNKLISHCILLLLFCTHSAKSQNNIIDSLQTSLKSLKEDSNKVNVLNTLSLQMEATANYEEAIAYANKALQLSQKIAHKPGTALAYKYMAFVFEDQLGVIHAH